ncbi:MAG: 4-hydroxy-tetrahydrodipicolinate reductase [Phycisphaerales bacterium]|nr:4-hydroxy-tetrahydrodipicolinate reductase [Phycisphaerales bacterium]
MKLVRRIQLAVTGATGRMGQRVLALASEDARFELVAALTEDADPRLGKPTSFGRATLTPDRRRTQPCDVLVDFSTPDGTIEHLRDCVRDGVPVVIGTTGHDAVQSAEIEHACSVIPVLHASNFSLGVNLLLSIVGRLANSLGPDFDIEIVEGHHRRKADAPSGTALSLLDAILRETGRSRDQHVVFGRQGQTGQRPAGQIGVHAVRMGDLVGEHEIHFAGPGETITLKHSALSRDTFAAGALRAALWLAGKPPGRYAMAHVLGEGPEAR